MENSKNMKNFKKKIIKNGKYFLKKHIEDIREIAEKGKKKLKKAKNMIQERKKEENVAYTFQPQDNKKYHDKIKKDFHEKQEESLELLKQVGYENNKITRVFAGSAFPCENAYDSQAQMELMEHYCERKQCLNCSIGEQIVRRSGDCENL